MNSSTASTVKRVIDLPITEVVVFEDRAQVVRRGSVTLSSGCQQLAIEHIAPVVADATLSARFTADDGPRVGEATVQRRHRDVDEQERRDLDKQLATLRGVEAEKAVLNARQRLLEKQGDFAKSNTKRTIEDVVIDASWNRDPTEEWQQTIEGELERERQIRETLLRVGRKMADTDRQVEDLRQAVHEHHRPDDMVAAEVVLTVVAEDDGQWPLEVRYTVPAACWRPWHTALIDESPDNTSLVFTTEGCVWQNTGEDWSGVRLLLSTQRPSLGTEPPFLNDDILTAQPKPEATTVMVRDQVVQTTGLGSEVTVAQDLPGIDDGGEVRILEVTGPATIVSDGYPHRLPLYDIKTATTLSLEAIPERAPAVVTKAVQINVGKRPILAGPVDLVRSSGLVGRSSTGFVAPGERFALGFGPDSSLTVRRRVDEVDEPRKALSRQARTTTTVTLFLSNLGPEERVFDVTERIPVSELEEVKIELDSTITSDGARADDNGFVHWRVSLPGDGRRTLRLAYSVRRHRDIDGF